MRASNSTALHSRVDGTARPITREGDRGQADFRPLTSAEIDEVIAFLERSDGAVLDLAEGR